jgi:hypothetical protein
MPGISILMAVLALQGGPDTASVGLRVVYDTTETKVTSSKSASPGEKETRGTLTLRITADALAVRKGDVERIYDFTNRRIIGLLHDKQEAYDGSLYAVAGFRDIELENRKVQARFLEALGKTGDMADVETQFGMRQDPPAKVRLKEQRRDDLRVFVLNDQKATSFLGADRSVPPSLYPMLTRLYLYAANVHPLIRAELVKEARLPAKLEYSWRAFEERTTVTWSLRELADEPFDLAATRGTYPVNPLESEGLFDLAWRVRTGQAGSPPSAAAYTDRARRFLDEGRALEAFLALFESSMVTGDTPSDLTRLRKDRSSQDARMQAVARALELERRDPKEALAQLESLDPASVEGGHVIHVLRASQRLRLEQPEEALKEFGLALEANPFLVGTWLDAGQVYYGRYEAVRAWTCWDAARAAAPRSALLKRLDELEASLHKKHPEYF